MVWKSKMLMPQPVFSVVMVLRKDEFDTNRTYLYPTEISG